MGPAAIDAAWVAHAACRGQSELFFPSRGENDAHRQAREGMARQVCASCPVVEPCRIWARDHREYGVWGGESEEDRARAGYFVEFPVGRLSRVIREIRRTRAAVAPPPGRGGSERLRTRPSPRATA